jgi:hypothetical protein
MMNTTGKRININRHGIESLSFEFADQQAEENRLLPDQGGLRDDTKYIEAMVLQNEKNFVIYNIYRNHNHDT